MPWLINAAQLEKFRKNQKNLIIFDASLHMPSANRNAKEEFQQKHIIDSHFFDIEELSDPQTGLPHMLLSDEAALSEKLGKLGIRNDFKIIFYDNSDLHSSCRALWMLKAAGHNDNLLYILDGGFSAWEKFGGKTSSGATTPSIKTYNARLQQEFIRSCAQIKKNLVTATEQIIDLRHPVRYAGGPEPRANLRQGHIPDSFSFPFFTMFDKEGSFFPVDKIRKQLTDIGVDLSIRIVTTCGSAVTAPILNFVLDLLGISNHAVYDGSWSEWGLKDLLPGEESILERPVVTSLDND